MAELRDINVVPPAMVGDESLVSVQGLTFGFDWGTFSTSTSRTATGSFSTAGLQTVRVRVQVSAGSATYRGTDKFGNPISVTKKLAGSASFETDVDVVEVASADGRLESPPGSSSSSSIEICKDSTAKYTATTNPSGHETLLKWQVIHTDPDPDEILESGTGGVKTRIEDTAGRLIVRFFCDANGNGSWDTNESMKEVTVAVIEAVLEIEDIFCVNQVDLASITINPSGVTVELLSSDEMKLRLQPFKASSTSPTTPVDVTSFAGSTPSFAFDDVLLKLKTSTGDLCLLKTVTVVRTNFEGTLVLCKNSPVKPFCPPDITNEPASGPKTKVESLVEDFNRAIVDYEVIEPNDPEVGPEDIIDLSTVRWVAEPHPGGIGSYIWCIEVAAATGGVVGKVHMKVQELNPFAGNPLITLHEGDFEVLEDDLVAIQFRGDGSGKLTKGAPDNKPGQGEGYWKVYRDSVVVQCSGIEDLGSEARPELTFEDIVLRFPTVVETVGTLCPGLDLMTVKLEWHRDAEGSVWVYDPNVSQFEQAFRKVDERRFRFPAGVTTGQNDPGLGSDESGVDDAIPDGNRQIFDADCPRIQDTNVLATSIGTIATLRANFRVWVTDVARTMVASNVLEYHVTITIKKIRQDPGTLGTWKRVNRPGEFDNEARLGFVGVNFTQHDAKEVIDANP